MGKTALVIHPFPCAYELPEEMDQDLRVVYLHQTHYGLQLRMAILCDILNFYPKFCRFGPNDKP